MADIVAKVFLPCGSKNSAGRGCDFHVKMWGTSSPDDKLTGDLGNVIEVTQIRGHRADRLMARKLSSSNFGLLQQYRHKTAFAESTKFGRFWSEADMRDRVTSTSSVAIDPQRSSGRIRRSEFMECGPRRAPTPP